MVKLMELLNKQPVPIVPTIHMNGQDYPADNPKVRAVFGGMRDGAKKLVATQTADRVTELLLERMVMEGVTDEENYVEKSRASIWGLMRGIESLGLEETKLGRQFVLARMTEVYSDDAPSTQHVFNTIQNLLFEDYLAK